jgi:voltage-gated potassium channel
VNPHNETILDELLVVLLALLSVFLLFVEVTSNLTHEQERVLGYADVAIASLFLLEFSYRLKQSENKRKFFRHHGWELLASIPLTYDALQALRALQLLRLVRLIRLLRLIRFATRVKVLAEASKTMAKYRSLIVLTTIVAIIIFSAALAFHYFESGTNQNIHTLSDSIWWSVTTVTTVGYGDIYPVTSGGRGVAVLLMLVGIGTLGTYTGLIASYVIENRHEDREQS